MGYLIIIILHMTSLYKIIKVILLGKTFEKIAHCGLRVESVPLSYTIEQRLKTCAASIKDFVKNL